MSQSITEKRTVITHSSSNYEDSEPASYRYKSTIHPRNTVLTSRSSSGGLGGGSSIRRTVEISSSSGGNYMQTPGAYANISATGVNNLKSSREREKKDMQDLNERFANYIEKVRFLEAQNRKLASELETLRSKWGKETSAIKDMYETELAEARKLIDDTNKEKARLELRISALQEQVDDLLRQLDEAKRWRGQDRETINKLNQQVSDLESEVRMLRRSNESLETDRTRDRDTIRRLQEELEKLRVDLSNESLMRLDAENRRQTLEEEIEFLKEVHDQEMKELSALAYRDTTAENREFWRNELSQAIRDIQNEYDNKCDQIRGEMESYYNLKIQEFRTGATKHNMEVTHAKEEVKKLNKVMGDNRARLADLEARNAQLEKQYQTLLQEFDRKEEEHAMETQGYKDEITKLRAEMESMLQELQTIMDAKLSLELEIAAYRKLLEGEENRVGLRTVVEQVVSSQSRGATRLVDYINAAADGRVEATDSQLSMKMMRGEVSAKTTYQRSSTGPIAIAEVSPEGKFIVLENTSSGSNARDVAMKGWAIKRKVDGQRTYSYTFGNYTLMAGNSVKIWAKDFSAGAGASDIINQMERTWGTGTQVTTTLQNEKNEEKASHVQKTLYS